ncbi:MAG: tetratricopeptide repeat protein [Methanosarcina sp.]|uniref:tetratricopeptide repeat protein n=1 Tax=Methanosarcina sp. TaxID=2213 RepID=UPI002609755E|nr:tetratricopeptide repeat protein [Methanosarcina sp.]MDD3248196.1 tetratricopeptide repeat protein [Methanosarcina sp.]
MDIDESIKAFGKAIDILEVNLLVNKRAPDTWYHIGLVFYNLEEFEKAIEAFDEVIIINPESIDAWNNKGLALYKLEKYAEALQAFDNAITFFPDKKNYDAWNNRGLVLLEIKNYIESEKSFKKAIELDPMNFEAYNNLGMLCFSQGKIGEAYKHFNKAIELNKNSHETLVNIGFLLLYATLYKKSIDVFDKALSLSPSSTCYLCKGIASWNYSRYTDTKTNLEKAINILEKRLNINFDERFRKIFQINSVLSHLALGKLYFNAGITESASKEISLAKYFADKSQDLPSNLKSLLNYLEGKLEIENSEYKDAMASFQKALYKDPSQRKFVLWNAYARYLNIEFSYNQKSKYQQGIVSIIRGLESTLSLSDELTPEKFIDKLKVKISDFFLKIQENFPSLYSKLPISTKMHLLEDFYKKKNREEELLLRANTHYFLGCFYYKINDFFSSMDEFEKCYKLKPGGKLQKSSRNFLEIIMKYQIKPPWWQWWLCSPVHGGRKSILFFVLAIFVFALTLLHPLIYPIIFRIFSNFTDVSLNLTSYGIISSQNFSSIDWALYFVIVITFIFILLYPSIEYIRSKDVEIKIQSTQPLVEFYFSLCTPNLKMIPSLRLEEMKKCPSLIQPLDYDKDFLSKQS